MTDAKPTCEDCNLPFAATVSQQLAGGHCNGGVECLLRTRTRLRAHIAKLDAENAELRARPAAEQAAGLAALEAPK